MLTVQNGSGVDVVVERNVSSPTEVDGLRAATNYMVSLVFVFVGGGEGEPANLLAVTVEGGKTVHAQYS